MHILFLCVANSARSQMAEGLARHLFKDKATISSAGSAPSRVNPFAVAAMQDIGIDISQHWSKPIAEVIDNNVDLVITLCAEEECPVLPAKIKQEHWPFPDPGGAAADDQANLASFKSVRDDIRQKLIQFGSEHGLIGE